MKIIKSAAEFVEEKQQNEAAVLNAAQKPKDLFECSSYDVSATTTIGEMNQIIKTGFTSEVDLFIVKPSQNTPQTAYDCFVAEIMKNKDVYPDFIEKLKNDKIKVKVTHGYLPVLQSSGYVTSFTLHYQKKEYVTNSGSGYSGSISSNGDFSIHANAGDASTQKVWKKKLVEDVRIETSGADCHADESLSKLYSMHDRSIDEFFTVEEADKLVVFSDENSFFRQFDSCEHNFQNSCTYSARRYILERSSSKVVPVENAVGLLTKLDAVFLPVFMLTFEYCGHRYTSWVSDSADIINLRIPFKRLECPDYSTKIGSLCLFWGIFSAILTAIALIGGIVVDAFFLKKLWVGGIAIFGVLAVSFGLAVLLMDRIDAIRIPHDSSYGYGTIEKEIKHYRFVSQVAMVFVFLDIFLPLLAIGIIYLIFPLYPFSDAIVI